MGQESIDYRQGFNRLISHPNPNPNHNRLTVAG